MKKMKPKDWNLCLEYTAFECSEFPDISWDVYTMYDGRKGILLNSLDNYGNVYNTVYCGICNSFEEFEESFWNNMKRLF